MPSTGNMTTTTCPVPGRYHPSVAHWTYWQTDIAQRVFCRTRIPVHTEGEMLGKDCGNEHERGRDSVRQAIVGRRFDCGRANGFRHLTIEEKEPKLDKHRHA